MQLLHFLEIHKDAFLSLAALISPFAAVALGIYTSRQQNRSSTQNLKRQLRATVEISYQQKKLDDLRQLLANQLGLAQLLRFQRPDAMQDLAPHKITAECGIIVLLTDHSPAASAYIESLQSISSLLIKMPAVTADWSVEQEKEFGEAFSSLGIRGVELMREQIGLTRLDS